MASILLEPRSGADDPRTLLATMMGADFSARSDVMTSADRGAGHIRRVLHELACADLFRGRDLSEFKVIDHGDAHAFNNAWEGAWTEIIAHAARAWEQSPFLICLGGDQTISWPLLTTAHQRVTRLGVVHVDAQRDIRGTERGVSDRNVMRGIVEHGLVKGTDLVQVGLNRFANDPELERVAHDLGIVGVTIDQLRDTGIEQGIERALWSVRECDGIWLSVDVECLDRSFAPGTTTGFAGGLVPAELDQIVEQVCGYPACIGMDVVEFDPERDIADITAQHVARLVMVALSARAGRLQRS